MHLRALGFSIDAVRKLLNLADERRRPCAEVRVVAATHLQDVHAKIGDLRAMERVLSEIVARCVEGKGSDCPLIEALYREGPVPAAQTSVGRSRRRPRRIRAGLDAS